MVVGFKTTYVISDVVSSNLDQGEVYSIPDYVKKFVSDVRQVGGFLRISRFPPRIKLYLFTLNVMSCNRCILSHLTNYMLMLQ